MDLDIPQNYWEAQLFHFRKEAQLFHFRKFVNAHTGELRVYTHFPYAGDKSQAKWITYSSRSDQPVLEACCCCQRLPSSCPDISCFSAHPHVALSGHCSKMKWLRDPFSPCVPHRNLLWKWYKAIYLGLDWNVQISVMEKMKG